jgi:hypothetical protein
MSPHDRGSVLLVDDSEGEATELELHRSVSATQQVVEP